jgi:hypothetical protein
MGAPLKSAQPLPPRWFLVGPADVTNPSTHKRLKERYGKEYVSGFDEGPVGYLCLKQNGGYVSVTTSDFGPGVEYSVAAPRCLKCGVASATENNFVSGTGLQLGLTKAKASALLHSKIEADLTDVTFEETETTLSGKALHTQVLSLEFKDDRLIRFSVYDYREGVSLDAKQGP